mmetsp:Transcript_118576/g.221561  ORF Transcript_118576/g.221561 Transcript_118576/m.221561 type:complete len:302 (+) Transcript_118576:89-994(+)
MAKDPDADPKWTKVRDRAREAFGKDVIWRFRGGHFFMSNMYMADDLCIEFEGLRYASTEHAFIAAKTLDHMERQDIRDTADPKDAKRAGRQLQLREDWDDMRFEIMPLLLREKFAHPQLAQQLLETGSCPLVEGNLWHDTEWGMAIVDDQLQGDNRLGEFLMQIRAELATRGIDECKLAWQSEAEAAASRRKTLEGALPSNRAWAGLILENRKLFMQVEPEMLQLQLRKFDEISSVDWDACLALMSSFAEMFRIRALDEPKLVALFKKCDKDCDGLLCEDEAIDFFRVFLQAASQKSCTET